MIASAARGPITAPAIQVLLGGLEEVGCEEEEDDWEAGEVERVDELEEGEPSKPLE